MTVSKEHLEAATVEVDGDGDGEEITEHVVRLKEGAEGWRKVNGPELTPEDPFFAGLLEEVAKELVRRNHAIRGSSVEEARAFYRGGVPLPFDPEAHTVAELRDVLDEADLSDDELDALAAAEADCLDRTSALEAIEAARSG